jgi:HK97 family phage major capsid protein
MNLEELIKAAKAAIAAGNLEEADKLYEQAKALKAVNELEPPDTSELDALTKERDELKAKLDNAPATNGVGHVAVTEDEADKANERNPFGNFGEFLMSVKAASDSVMDERLLSIRSTDRMDEGGFSIAGAMGDDFVGSFQAAAQGIKSFGKAAPTGVGESMPQTGGFLVGSQRQDSILSRVYESGQLLSRVSMDPVGPNSNGMTYFAEAETSRATGSRRGGVRFYWMAENSSVTASAPTFREMDLKLKKAAALVYVTEEQLQDTPAMESYVMRIMPEEIRWGVEDSILNGTGTGMPLGLETSNAVVSQAKETGQAADTIVYENIVKMWSRLWAPSQSRSIWLHSQDALPQLMTMTLDVGTGGVPVYTPPGGASAAPFGTIFGRPAFVHESADNVGDVGDIWLLDPTEYQMIEKGGLMSASSIHVRFLQGETAFRFIWRIDGQPMWNSALTPFNGGDTVSPYVNLAERA